MCRLTGLSISAKRAVAWQTRLSWREVSGLTRVTEPFGVRQGSTNFSDLAWTLRRKFGRLDIDWTPEHLSASFHGRDLFAPVAGLLACREPPPGQPRQDGADRRADWPDDLGEIVYVDHYGNAMTGVRAALLPSDARIAAAGRVLERAGTFSDLPPGGAFWYENSNRLEEIAFNQGRADHVLGLAIGTVVEIVS